MKAIRGAEFYNKIFQNFLKTQNIHHYSRYTDKGPSIAERVNKTIRNMLKKPIFLKGNSNWVDELSSITKKYNEIFHHSIKMTPLNASKKINEDEVYFNLSDKRKKHKPKYSVGNLVRTANKRNIFFEI